MKKIKSLIVLLFSCLLSYSQPAFKISGNLSNGKIISPYEIFYLNDNSTFMIIDASGNKQKIKSCTWYFRIENKGNRNEKYETIKESNTNDSFTIYIDSSLYINKELFSQFKREISTTDRSTYYLGIIECKGVLETDMDIDLSFPIKINLLPETPYVIVKSIDWGSYYDEQYDYFYDAYITFQMSGKRTDEFFIGQTGNPPIISYPFIPDIDEEENIGSSEIMRKNVYFTFWARNENGYSSISPDTIYISPLYTKNEISKTDVNAFYPNPVEDLLYVSGSPEEISDFSLRSIKGEQLIYMEKISNTIDLSSLNEGIYIISFFNSKRKKTETLKLIKQ